jgi:hypothetical protein
MNGKEKSNRPRRERQTATNWKGAVRRFGAGKPEISVIDKAISSVRPKHWNAPCNLGIAGAISSTAQMGHVQALAPSFP